ncbi:heavy metal-binding domain-containing protein [bacterium]|nr:heavy metal-binding domain-containing protein [bacterium]
MDLLISIIITLFFLLLAFTTGTLIEKAHFNKLKKMEIALIKKPVVTYGTKHYPITRKIKKIELVHGESVIAGDYFKYYVASLKNIFGGRLTTLESIMDRARRQAIVRMKEQAKDANLIVNVRIESAMLNHVDMKNSIPKCAVFAYGTAITYE